jgi:hypothetical protein
MKGSHRPFIFLLALLLCKAVHGDGDDESEEEVLVEDWFDLIRYLMGLAFLIFGIFFVLYSDIATYSMLRCYNKTGRIVPGEVLSCEDVPGHVKKFEIEVLYSADTAQFKDSRNKFRYPDAMETKEYLRRFQTDWKTPRGSMIELIILPGIPTSACTSEMIRLKLNSLSKLGTGLIAKLGLVLPPALTLIGIFSYLVYRKVTEFSSRRTFVTSLVVVGLCLILFLFISLSICDHQFQDRKRRVFHSAVCVRRKNGSRRSYTKETPLIQYNEEIPVVVGRELDP